MFEPGDSLEDVWQRLLTSAAGVRTPHFELDDSALNPLRELLQLMGDPQRDLRCIHIAGSKGKGSTALLLEQALRSQDARVGVFTSPHLQHWCERFRLAGTTVDDDALLSATADVARALQRHGSPERVRFFDRLVAIALQLFASARVDFSIIETGIGGRFDATNVIDPAVAIITSIEREHTDVLGETIGEIALQKAGIIKPGVPTITTARETISLDVIHRQAQAQHGPLLSIGDSFDVQDVALGKGSLTFRYRGNRQGNVKLASLAPVQADNTAAALAAFELLFPDADLAAPIKAMHHALPGRCEYIATQPPILLDVAHTPASLEALGQVVASLAPTRLQVLIAASSSRHLNALAKFAGTATKVVVTQADKKFSLPTSAIADAVRSTNKRATVVEESETDQALTSAKEGLGPGDLLCVTGSTYLVGRVRSLLVTTD